MDIWNFLKPTIAAVNDPAMGGGFDLATLCDLTVSSESAVFGHPEISSEVLFFVHRLQQATAEIIDII